MTLCPEPRIDAENPGARSCRFCAFFLVPLVVFISIAAGAFAQSPDSLPSPAAPASSTSTPSAFWDNGLQLRSRSGWAQMEIGGMLQVDGRSFIDSGGSRELPGLILRRGRLVLQGTTFRRITFRIMAESKENGPMLLRDAYADFQLAGGMRLEAGKFKSPIGLERLQPARDLMFAERALTANLVPNRDLGIELHGDASGLRISYRAGLFRGVPDGGSRENRANHGAEVEYRLFAHPFLGARRPLLDGLGVGIGGSAGSAKGALPSFTTPGLERFFFYRNGAVARGGRMRLSPQASFYWRRVGALAEYVRSAQDVRLGGVARRVANTAWQASASYVLTGENASASGVTPAHPFHPASGEWGAFELAGRFNSLQIDPSVFPLLANPAAAAGRARGFQAGLNWYPRKSVKIVINYAQTAFTGGAAAGDRPAEKVLIVRFQFSCY